MGGAVVTFFVFKPLLHQYLSFSVSFILMGTGGIVVGRLGQFQVWESFEVSVAMEECASASSSFACPS